MRAPAPAAAYRNKWSNVYISAASTALTGMVSIQAQTRLTVTPQRTADSRLVAPTPTMAPVMVWVVLTGIPRVWVRKRVMAPAVSAQTPSRGLTLVIRVPMVFTIRQPSAHGTEGDGAEAGNRYPIGNMADIVQVAVGYHGSGDDPQDLLRVVAAMSQAEQGGGE